MRAARIQAREPSSGAGRALAVGARHIALLAEEVRSRGTSVDSPLLGALPIAPLLSAGAARCLVAPGSITIGTPALTAVASRLGFDFIDGDGAVNNSATIFGFHLRFRFGRLRRAATVTGSVRAALPGSVNLADTSVFSERLQG